MANIDKALRRQDKSTQKWHHRFIRLTRPRFWFQNEPTCFEYDAILRKALRCHGITFSHSDYTVRVGGLEVWVSNYPYAYGRPYGMAEVLPAAQTRILLNDMVQRERLKRIRCKIDAATHERSS